MKLDSLLTQKDRVAGLKDKYEEIYGQSDVWLYKKSHGVHSVILGAIKQELAGSRYLDLGCGAGRLPIMCSFLAKEVVGVDFSQNAIELATLCARVAGAGKVRFLVNDLDEFCRDCGPAEFQVISLLGVLEHTSRPQETLDKVSRLLAPGGLLVVSCPNFVNFRGATYMTLLTLLDLPMSLADLWQIDVGDIRAWSPSAGLRLEKTLGAIYNFAFSQKAAADMQKRVPLAVRDKKLDIDINYQAYNEWLDKMAGFNQEYLEWLAQRGVLRKISKPVEIQVAKDLDIPGDLLEKVSQYLEEDITSDPYYCEEPPFCYFGGEGIYLLRKDG